jgi:diaminohydroxyphosphoribosylaminopyrimidine deaminase/5-amino-6-(5-phosphoribosylamino)uracil reductase
VHHIRAGSDAIAVGMGTVLADDPLLTVRDVPSPRVAPARVIFSRSGRLPPTSRLAKGADETRVIVFAMAPDPSHDALRNLGVEVITTPSLLEAMRALRQREIRSLLVEGGADLAASILEADLVDRVVLFQAPVILGDKALSAFGRFSTGITDAHRFRPLHSEWVGDDHMMVLAPRGH